MSFSTKVPRREWTPEKRALLKAEILPWATTETARGFRFTTKALTEEFRIPDRIAHQILNEWVAQGLIVSLSKRGTNGKGNYLGWAVRGAALATFNLAELMIVIQPPEGDQGAELVRAKKGPKARDELLGYLTTSQWKDAKSAANLIAKSITGESRNWSGVAEQELVGWDADAGQWALLGRVAEWSNANHRSEWLKKKKAEGGTTAVWSPTLNTGLSKHVASAKNILEMGVAIGRIHPATPVGTEINYVGGPQRRFSEAWCRALCRAYPERNEAMIKLGCRTIALWATRRRETSMHTADVLAIRADIEAWYAKEKNGPQHNTVINAHGCARLVWRLGMDLLQRRGVIIPQAHAWGTARDTRMAIVSDGAMTAAADWYDQNKDHGYAWDEEWVDKNGTYVRALVEGRPAREGQLAQDGLRDWTWWSVATPQALGRDPRFPAREHIDPDPHMQRAILRAKGKQLGLLARATLIGRYREIARLAGFAQSAFVAGEAELAGGHVQQGYDFVARDGLAALCNLNLILAYAEHRREEEDDERDGSVSRGSALLAKNLSMIASPFLEGRARILAEEAKRAGSADEAAAYLTEADRLRQVAKELKVWGYRNDSAENVDKDIEAIMAAWHADGVEGWFRLDQLVGVLVANAEREAGMTLTAQLEVMRAAELATPKHRTERLRWQTNTWALALRGAMLVNFVRKVPVRARAISEMRLDWWVARDTATNQCTDAYNPEAAVAINIPAWAVKTRDDYSAAWMRAQDVGDATMERGARRGITEAWLHPLGARAFLLTEWREVVETQDGTPTTYRIGDVVPSAFFFPSTHGERWTSPALSTTFSELVLRHAQEIGLDREQLQQLAGATRIHVSRLLFGTYWVPQNSEYARLSLGHSNIVMTQKKYAALSRGRMNAEGPLDNALMSTATSRMQALVDAALKKQEEALEAAEQRAAAAEEQARTAQAILGALAQANPALLQNLLQQAVGGAPPNRMRP